MRARVLGMALLLLTAAATAARTQDSASSPENQDIQDIPRTAAAHRSAEVSVPAAPLVFHRQNAFAIPFLVNQNSPTPLDVILYASADLGATWDQYSRQQASQKQFVFRAARDGEYWFTSQLVGTGLSAPNAVGLVPQLRIVVDTQAPRLKLEAKSEPSGMVHVDWEAYDETLVPEKVTLHYQTNPGQAWKPLEIEKSPTDGLQQSLRGETRFQPDRGATLVAVRLEARDSADNAAELSRRLFLPLNITSAFGPPAPRQPTTEVPADPFAQHGFPPVNPAQAPDLALPPSPTGEVRPPEPAAQGSAVAWPSRETGKDGWQSPQPHYQSSTSSASQPLVSEQPVAREAVASARAQDVPADFPPGERPRMTNARRFNLDYSIDAVGPQGVEKVELWVTRNGGQDWQLWSVDEDRESPLLVEVEEEGIYGFRIVIVGKNGLTSQTPRAGEPADLWVGVDTTSPVAEITSAAYGKDEYAGHLDIRWTATDSGFGARPITLLFSEQRQGPWTTIASGLPNTGQYYWRVDSRVPDQFYLKIEVRDEAGNLTVARLDEPIRSAGLIPRGRIRGVEPAN